jgi:fructoselysine/glucoselysine PTS system EIIB component
VVESIKDAKTIAEACNIKEINLGGTKATSETRNISKAMNVTKEEEQMIRDMVSEGIKVDIRMVPTDKSLDALSAL